MVFAEDKPLVDCSAEADVLRQIFRKKWRLKVLNEIAEGPVRLSDLRRRMPDCSKKMIVDTLHGLEKLAWIERQDVSTRVRRVEYRLSPPCAETLVRVVKGLVE